MTKIKDDKEAEFYLTATKEYGWSRNVLLNQIKTKAYKRALFGNKTHNFKTALPGYEKSNIAMTKEIFDNYEDFRFEEVEERSKFS